MKGSELEAERMKSFVRLEKVNLLEGELHDVKLKCDELTTEKVESAEDADLVLLQLHQIQEELEYYFNLSRYQRDLLVSHEKQQKRAEKLLASSFSVKKFG